MGGKPKTKNPNGILGMGNGKGSGSLGPIWRGLAATSILAVLRLR
jgi:hypothetical protein